MELNNLLSKELEEMSIKMKGVEEQTIEVSNLIKLLIESEAGKENKSMHTVLGIISEKLYEIIQTDVHVGLKVQELYSKVGTEVSKEQDKPKRTRKPRTVTQGDKTKQTRKPRSTSDKPDGGKGVTKVETTETVKADTES